MDCDEALSMWSVRACRICLAVGVKFHTIGPLHSCYQALVALAEVRRPVLVCYECVAYLRRFRQLRDKSQRTQTLLTSMLQKGHVITQETVESINREKINLQTKLKIQCLDYWEVTEFHVIETELKKESDAEELNVEEDTVNEWKRDEIEGTLWKEDGDITDELSKRDGIIDAVVKTEATPYDTEFLAVGCDFNEDISVIVKNKARKKRIFKKSIRKPRARKIVNKDIKVKKKLQQRRARRKSIKQPQRNNSIPFGKAARIEFFRKFVDVLPMTQEEAMEDVMKRKQSRNYKIGTYKCELCFKAFWEKSTYNNHASKHDEKMGALECDYCHFRFCSRRRLTQHMGQCHKWKFCCRKCVYVAGDGSRATKHEAWHNGKQYSCKECNKTFSFYSTMMNHKRKEHAKEISCRLCGLCFVGQHGVTVHTHKVHGGKQIEDEGGHKCTECNIDFACLKALKRHLVVSAKHNLKEIANGCEECGEVFPTRDDYRRHHRKKHARKIPSLNERNRLSHGLSPEAFLDKAPKKKMTKEEMADFKMDIPQSFEPNRHMCDVCGKILQSSYTLRYHLLQHTGDLPHKCSFCSKDFRSKETLDEHTRTHTREKPFKCKICAKPFAQSGNLTRHMKTVHETKQVRCDICSKMFKNNIVLKDHVKYVHLKVPYPVRKGRKRKADDSSLNPLTGRGN